jgi:virginiamycin A acetyltransferase
MGKWIRYLASMLPMPLSWRAPLYRLSGIEKTAEVVIEDDAYIGAKATILPGVRIGRMATVSANTLVASNVPDYGVVVGVPGRVFLIRQRPGEESDQDQAG